MQSRISDVKAWATANMLKINDNKTKLTLVTSKRTKHLHSLPISNTMGNVQIPFKHSFKNFRFTLCCHLTMNEHVSIIAWTCCFELCHLASIHGFLTNTAIATLVSAFGLSRIKYCNSLLLFSTHGVTSHLQWIQNYAASVILRIQRLANIAIHLNLLHWLSVKVGSTYKTARLSYHCCSSSAPSYISAEKNNRILAMATPANIPHISLIDLHTFSKHSVIAHFLLLISNGTLFEIMSGVPHNCHHLCLV